MDQMTTFKKLAVLSLDDCPLNDWYSELLKIQTNCWYLLQNRHRFFFVKVKIICLRVYSLLFIICFHFSYLYSELMPKIFIQMRTMDLPQIFSCKIKSSSTWILNIFAKYVYVGSIKLKMFYPVLQEPCPLKKACFC